MRRYEDERGVIQDLLGPVDAVTAISTEKGAVRGNHIHAETDQWTYVVSGRLLSVQEGIKPRIVGPGTGLVMILEPHGRAHAWKALEDTVCLVFTKGPRSGENYESDTERLAKPLIESGADWAAAEGISRTSFKDIGPDLWRYGTGGT